MTPPETFAELCARDVSLEFQVIQLDDALAPWRRSYVTPNTRNVVLRSKRIDAHRRPRDRVDWNDALTMIHANKENFWVHDVSLAS